ncbi:hypothetical protein MKX01_016671 [Papaver californicum]|nr:hypothetical protein MKX01_016671 [Papaver californicum]
MWAESPVAACSSELNLQLLASCSRTIIKHTAHFERNTIGHSRYLFGIACLQIELYSESEGALCPPNESTQRLVQDLKLKLGRRSRRIRKQG